MNAVRLQLMIDQIVLGLQALGARRARVPQCLVDGHVHVANVLPQIARVRVHFGAVRTAWAGGGGTAAAHLHATVRCRA